jgi:hypothetical protein
MLNPRLFQLLQRRFGDVKVQAADQPMISRHKFDPTQSLTEVRQSLHVDHSGEEYIVKCPFCRDWKHRLYINHRWGTVDPITGSRNLWLAHCWNEECLSDYDNQIALYDQVMEYTNIGPIELAPVAKSNDSIAVHKTKKYSQPGVVWLLDDMKRRTPRHDAIKYVEDRLWDPVYLAEQYEIGYCVETAYFSEVKGRLVAPVYMHGKPVGWQARYLGEVEKGIQKWWNCPGFSKSSALYNHDRMAQCQTKVIVEGPADVWNFGPQATGLFGKTMSVQQQKLFCDTFREGDVAVILLDAEMDEKSKARGEVHHIEKLHQQLITEPRLGRRVIRVYLPHGSDPDELDREYMRELIKYEGRRNNLPITFTKPK